jgi:uncharacterized membrane protein YqjE
MDFRMLQAIQRAIPILLRHLDGYIELAEQDWSAAKVLAKERAQTWVILLASSIFAVVATFVFIVALTWDTEYRLLTIGGLAGLAVAIAVGAAIRLKRRPADRAFATIRREWERDRAIVRRLLTESQSAS